MTTDKYNKLLKNNFDEALALSINKNADYADKDDPFKNFKLSAAISGVPVEKGLMVRMSDKIVRAANLLERKNVIVDEKITDTLRDLANYANILSVYISEEK